MSAGTQISQGLPLNLPPGAVVRLLRAQGGMPKGATLRPLRSRDQIGRTEPETGRPVLQQSPRAEVNQAAATAEHPAVRVALAKAIKPIAGAKLAGARDEKDPERVQEKIEDDGQSPRTVRDYSGFRIAVDTPAAHQSVASALRQQFEVPDEQDEFDEGNPETGFHGHTLQVREPGSPVSHEVQVLPREVAAHADSRHGLYEKARGGDDDAAAKLKAANEADWKAFQSRQGTGVAEQESGTATADPSTSHPTDEDLSAGTPVTPQDDKSAGAGEIDASQVKGEEFTGYEASDGKGEFACHNCRFSDENSTCGQPTMVAKSKLPREGDRVKIDPEGCCEYVDRKKQGASEQGSKGAEKPNVAGAASPKDKLRQMTAARRPGTSGEQAVAEKKNFEGRAVALADGGAGVVEHYQPAVNGSPARARVRMPDGKIRDNVKPADMRVLTEPPIDPESGWTAEDLDGTLAKYHGFKGKEVIGEPIPEEQARVKRMLAAGKDVRIFTARIADDTTGRTRAAIHAWCQQHLGQVLPVTNVKDDKMKQVRDDRAVALERNTGRIK